MPSFNHDRENARSTRVWGPGERSLQPRLCRLARFVSVCAVRDHSSCFHFSTEKSWRGRKNNHTQKKEAVFGLRRKKPATHSTAGKMWSQTETTIHLYSRSHPASARVGRFFHWWLAIHRSKKRSIPPSFPQHRNGFFSSAGSVVLHTQTRCFVGAPDFLSCGCFPTSPCLLR